MSGVRQFEEGAMLDAALKLFWKKGFAATSMQELAEVTGVQRGSLYNAYGDKETLFLRVFELYRARFLAEIVAAMDKPGLRDSLRSFFTCVINSMTTGLPTRGCMSTKTALAEPGMDPPVRAALRRLLDELEATLVAVLSRKQWQRHLNLTPHEAARLLVTFTRGMVVIERIYQEKARLQASSETLLSLLLDKSA